MSENKKTKEVEIKVLGSGCRNCQALLAHTKEAVAHRGIDAEVDYVTDMEKIMAYGVMGMPALVVDGKVVSTGKVLKVEEVERILEAAGA